MSGMAAVLAAHQDCLAGKNLGYYRTEYTCQCGGTFWAGVHEEDPSFAEANAAHQAAMLTAAGFGPVKEEGAIAWDMAAEYAREHGLFYDVEHKALVDANYYRAAAVRGES